MLFPSKRYLLPSGNLSGIILSNFLMLTVTLTGGGLTDTIVIKDSLEGVQGILVSRNSIYE